MHAVLSVKQPAEFWIRIVSTGDCVQTVEEGLTAVDNASFAEHFIVDTRGFCGLLNDGRKLSVVANENELSDERIVVLLVCCAENREDMRVQKLGRLVDDGHVEMLELPEHGLVRGHRRNRADDNPHVLEKLGNRRPIRQVHRFDESATGHSSQIIKLGLDGEVEIIRP